MCKNTLLKIAAPILLLIVLSPMIISTHQTKACIGPNRINVKGCIISMGTACLCWIFNVNCGNIVYPHLCYRVHPSSDAWGFGRLAYSSVSSHYLVAYLYVTFYNIFGQSFSGYEFNNIYLISPNYALVCYGFICVIFDGINVGSIHYMAYTPLPASVTYTFTIPPPPTPVPMS